MLLSLHPLSLTGTVSYITVGRSAGYDFLQTLTVYRVVTGGHKLMQIKRWTNGRLSARSTSVSTEPGAKYFVLLSVSDDDGNEIAFGDRRFKASKPSDFTENLYIKCLVFNPAEIGQLLRRALCFSPPKLDEFVELYRCKPRSYWAEIESKHGGVMRGYLKDGNGHPASPINGVLSGKIS